MADYAEAQVNPDFLLAFQEGSDEELPRRCWRVKRTAVAEHDDYLLVKVDLPINKQKYGLPGLETLYLILAPRWVGVSLFEIHEWPVFVNVLIPSVHAPQCLDALGVEDVFFIAIGEIVPAGSMDSAAHLASGGVRVGTTRPLPLRRPPKI